MWRRGALLLLLFLVSGCGPKETEVAQTPLRFAFQNRVGSAIPIVAVKKGYFAQKGLSVEPLRFNSGPACAEALYSASADIGTMGDITAIIAAVRHAGLKIIASHSTGEHRHRLIVKQDAPYRSLADLRNRRIGIKKGTSTHGGFLALLEAKALSPQDFNLVDLSPANMPAALIAGSVDAITASEPTPSLAEVKGGRELLTLGGMGNQYPILILVHDKVLQKRREDLIRFIEALRLAENFVRQNSHQTAELLSDTTGLPVPVVREAMQRHRYRVGLDETITTSLGQTAAFLAGQKKISVLPDWCKVFKPQLLGGQ